MHFMQLSLCRCKPEELEMPTEQEIADYLKKQQKKGILCLYILIKSENK